MKLKPFLNYFGSKYRLAPYYPAPQYDLVIEPFAGAAGYSVRHGPRRAILAELAQSVRAAWYYLFRATAADILRLPLLSHSDEDIRDWRLAHGPECLIAWNLSCGDPRPRYTLNGFAKKYRPPFPGHAADGRGYENFWGEKRRARIAKQVDALAGWEIYRDYRLIPNYRATWFIDPPYARSGKLYEHHAIDYAELADWCRSRLGQVIVCEQEGADWLPFRPFRGTKRGGHGHSKTARKELIWLQNEADRKSA